MLRAPTISWLTICPLGQPEKAIGFEPQIELWLALCNRTACRIRNRRCRHDNNMNLRKKKTPRASQHYMGWRAGHKSVLLPVAGEVFLLTLPFIERRYRKLTLACPNAKVKERLPLTSPRFPRYNRITRHACRHRRSCREGGDPVRYGLR